MDWGIHFIHEDGKGPNPLPLIITHGWPSTFWEILKIVPLLTDPGSHGGDPADSFHVVVPSMPGYGYSDRPTERGMDILRIADLWAQLMTEGLGYSRFGAQGGDWGASVTARLGYLLPPAPDRYSRHLGGRLHRTPLHWTGRPGAVPRQRKGCYKSGRPGGRPRADTLTSRERSPRPSPTG